MRPMRQRHPRAWSATVAVLLPLIVSQSRAEERPQFVPTRDVDVIYEVTRSGEQIASERVRWLASEHVERIDGPQKSITIIDQKANEVMLLNYSTRTFSQTEGASAWPIAPPDEFAEVRRRGEAVVAGLRCTEWSWSDDAGARVACLSANGVVLRLIVEGGPRLEARSVSYAAQDPEIFMIPPGYAPAVMAPETRRLVR
jgi:hypothetical protein